jgi:ADP-ribose pyrophosphatase
MSRQSERPNDVQPYTIVLGDGLDEQVLSPQSRHLAARTNVGEREIERLFGRGRGFGSGPLPTFLRMTLEKQAAGGRVGLILLGDTDLGERRFVPPVDEVAEQCRVIRCSPDHIPWDDLRKAVLEQSGIDPTDPADGRLRFLVVGCHTEERILALAVFLRRVFQCDEVAVSAHLVASATQEAHLAVLRHTLPGLGVRVVLDLGEAARFVGLDPSMLDEFSARPCELEPAEIREGLSADQQRIIELLCLHWSRARLRPLAGGFSGSLLFLADGWKGEARTEPMVLKVDGFDQMRRELAGYYLVKDFLGKHVPAFGYPVVAGGYLGVGMELAAMEGRPQTLQDGFEAAEDEASSAVFQRRLDKALSLLVEKLYRNTREPGWVVPYRDLGLHAQQQQTWLRENAELILGYLTEEPAAGEAGIDLDQLLVIFKLITANEAGLDGDLCLGHGDLNLANVICDEVDNVWLIDWTHCGRYPLELDFAKLENDVKFVMTKTFGPEDLSRLRVFEEYLVEHRLPAPADGLPEGLAFAKWDLRFRKMLDAVRRVRQACFSLKEGDDWVTYRVALLRYATHTLSFDERRGRGECSVTQLAHALHSIDQLAFGLVSDLFHLRVRTERPESYPSRQVITIDEAPWVVECPHYEPPYHVDPSVLAAVGPDGWADPEDGAALGERLAGRPAKHRDERGRPLNPTGRTGLAGRGLLGLWGSNLSVMGVLVRAVGAAGSLEVALGQEGDQGRLELPKGFVLPGEDPEAGVRRVLEAETGCCPSSPGEELSAGYAYDPRQTDHAWVETQALLFLDEEGSLPDLLVPGGDFEEIKWWPLDATTINRVPSTQALCLRSAVQRLTETGRLVHDIAQVILERTG